VRKGNQGTKIKSDRRISDERNKRNGTNTNIHA
jgi:hypothetical protein